MAYQDFFDTVEETSPFGTGKTRRRALNIKRIRKLGDGPLPADNDLESVLHLTRIVRAEYEAYGTDHNNLLLSDEDSWDALQALRSALKRHDIRFDPPWSPTGARSVGERLQASRRE